MTDASRIVASVTAAGGTLLQLAVIAATIPQWPECFNGLCMGDYPILRVSVDVWRPFIDNSGSDGAAVEREPRCPSPRGWEGGYGLAAAPLPDGYDPHAYGERTLFACVLVTRYGEVREVRMLRGTGWTYRDRSLLETIRGAWRFRVDAADPRPLSWQRVRLNSGPGGASIYDPPILE